MREPAFQKTAINLVALALLCLVISQRSDVFFTRFNVLNIFNQIAVVAIIGCAMTLLIVAGEFDLSVAGVAALTGVVAARLALDGAPLAVAFAAAIAVGILVGLLNAFLVVAMGITSFIATIGTLFVTQGLALIVSGGVAVSGMSISYSHIGNGYAYGYPYSMYMIAGFLVVFTIIQRWTILGRRAVASGSNPEAAFRAGVPVRQTRTICFVLCGASAGWGGVMISSRLGAGVPNSSTDLLFAVIVAAVVGGASLAGGQGRVIGTFLGALIIGVLNNGLDLTGVTSYWQTVTLGIVLVLAVGLDIALRHPVLFMASRFLRAQLPLASRRSRVRSENDIPGPSHRPT